MEELSKAKKRVFSIVFMLLMLLAVEGILRTYLCMKHGARFFAPARMILKSYPMLKTPMAAETAEPSVLLLGASVLEPDFGSVAEDLGTALEEVGLLHPGVFNTSYSAHSSRDSLFKYEALESTPFDYVLFYHGINEVRANNCPPDVFKEDYSHYAWYELLNVYHRHRNTLKVSVIPYAMDYIACRLTQMIRKQAYIAQFDRPPEPWLGYGSNILTAISFSNNLEDIIGLAESRGEKPVLMSYAYHLPPDYTLAGFTNKTLDYAEHTLPAELWGEPAHVVKGIQTHNQVIRNIADHRDVIFIDFEKMVPKSGIYFNDICHLSPKGCSLFGSTVAEAISQDWRKNHPD